MSAETVLIIPLVFTLLLVSIQAALFMHTAHSAQVTASEGARAAARFGGGVVAGAEAISTALIELGSTPDGIPSVAIKDGVAQVTVELRIPRVAPFFDLVVSRSATEPVERYLGPTER